MNSLNINHQLTEQPKENAYRFFFLFIHVLIDGFILTELMNHLHSWRVCTHLLEFKKGSWSPHLEKDIKEMERN
ncbi:hypothetical protein BpHYR1_016307 [Brachionus plicatilis]|uniref:Uncharacterized protein n=1 Tax=Brachionus plicatilis TaxID=10195 RepID=A0A3M7PII0_BRAPC|nr:hypothetical protein BpHYR1_016307 [Brachionus plicatilis]